MDRAERRRQQKMAKKTANKAPTGQAAKRFSGQQNLLNPQAMELAVQHHTAGRLAQAKNLYQQILQADPNQPAALHLLGLIAHQGGKNAIAVELISKALAIKPDYTNAHNNLGHALQQLGRWDEALASYRKALAIDPDYAEGHACLGGALLHLGRPDEALDSYHKALAINPDYAEGHICLGGALMALGRPEEAVDSCHKALAINPDYADAHNNLGHTLQQLGRWDEALASYRKALAIDPDYAGGHACVGGALLNLGRPEEAVDSCHKALAINPDLAMAHYTLGIALQHLGRWDEAIASYRKTLAIEPDHAMAFNNLGNALLELGRPDKAADNCRKALAIKPDFAEAHYNLAEALEKTNRPEALREAISNAKASCPGHPLLALGEARLLKRDGDYAAARTVLEKASEPPDANTRFLVARAHLLGELCDWLGDVDAAYNHFREGNIRTRENPETKPADGKHYLATIDVLAKRFTPGWVADWRLLESGDDRPDPVFMVGFPRSGTTLLDTILRSHAAITVVEEKPTIYKMMKALERLPGGYPDGLAELDPAHLAELRRTYFAELDKHLEEQDRSTIVIDKMPLNIVDGGLIQRIFPQARFLFVQRHPCDCALSCFMQNFTLNHAMANFLDMEDTAFLYDKIMTLWQQYQAVLPLRVHTVRYESLVEEFEETLAPVLDFLGVDWDEGVRNYAETAHGRSNINTPSYGQVTQPLYTRALNRWERYREHMQPALPLLLPWARRLGYDE